MSKTAILAESARKKSASSCMNKQVLNGIRSLSMMLNHSTCFLARSIESMTAWTYCWSEKGLIM